MCEGGKEEAENKKIARRPKEGKSSVESTVGASRAGLRRRACRLGLATLFDVDRRVLSCRAAGTAKSERRQFSC